MLFTRCWLYKGVGGGRGGGEVFRKTTAAIDSVFPLLQTLCTLCVFCVETCQHLSSASGGVVL